MQSSIFSEDLLLQLSSGEHASVSESETPTRHESRDMSRVPVNSPILYLNRAPPSALQILSLA
jgi:hypothetical protein